MAEMDRKELMSRVKSVVVKVGTAVLSDPSDRFDAARVGAVCAQVHELRKRGLTVVVVSSGAIGAGMAELGMKKRPTTLPELQAAAAVGQSHLMVAYDQNFRKHGYRAGQVLLTREVMNDRTRYLNARNAIHALLALGAVPVINENDAISVDEITFGDNDFLAATVTNLLRADLLVLLTTVEGLEGPGGEVVDVVSARDERAKEFVRAEKTRLGKGGMASKLDAADIARASGEMVVIASGLRQNVLVEILEGAGVGTLLLPSEKKLSSRARWIVFGARPRGTLVIDDGARRALVERGKSLLPSGVVAVEGRFDRGSVVNVVDREGRTIARGLVNYASAEAATIAGHKSSDIARLLGSLPYVEIVHRDNMVVL
jgi:glutamate 5-kinase